jgi:hypothetical protein
MSDEDAPKKIVEMTLCKKLDVYDEMRGILSEADKIKLGYEFGAKLKRAEFEALVSEGFTEEQAIRLISPPINKE